MNWIFIDGNDNMDFFQALQTLLYEPEHCHLTELGCKVTTGATCAIVHDFYTIYGEMPTLEDLILFHFKTCMEECVYFVPFEEGITIQRHTLLEYGCFVNCYVLHFFLVFYFTEGRYPRPDEIVFEDPHSQHITDLLHENTDEFWKNQSSGIQMDTLKKIVLEIDRDMCAICQEPMVTGQSVIELPCAHSFHSAFSECDGLEEWIKKMDSCPLCKKSISKSSSRVMSEMENK